VHTILLLYSLVMQPIIIGFRVELHLVHYVMEALCFVESVAFIAITFRLHREVEASGREAFLMYYRRGLVYDLLAVSPLLLVLEAGDVYTPLPLIAPLKALRLIAIMRIPSLLESIESRYIHFSQYIAGVKTFLFLVTLWHWSSCFWFFTNYQIESSAD
jgi:hypothetical protein